jgi:general secretion pathway protein A
MNEDYLKYWGMSKPPFTLTPDPEMLYLSNQHSECLMRLKYAIFSQKGGALLISDYAGNGKTSILAKLKNDLNDYYSGRVKVVFISHPTLTPIEIIGEIGHQLGTELHTKEKIRALNSLQDRLFALYNENIKVIVIVDEGQMLKERKDLLDELRILLNFCVSDAFLLTFIFSGQKPLDTVLRSMPEFWQRLPVRYFLKNLDYNDTQALIQYRIRKVGASEDIFNEDAFDGIYNYSKGCPRIICSVADLCLIVGFAKGVRRIGFVEVSIACRDMETSGDGFHYYTYLKSQQFDLFSKPEVYQEPPPEKKKKSAHVSEVPVINSVVCSSCKSENQKNLKFCIECGAPLYKKCPKCFTLLETGFSVCPICHTDMNTEWNRLMEEFRISMKPFDILEGWYTPCLQAKNLMLESNEHVLIIFPRGNFMTPGPSVVPMKKSGKVKKEDCDIILTDKRLILCIGGQTLTSNLNDIDTCMVSDTRKITGREYVLIVNIKDGMFRIMLPFGSGKTRKVMNSISTYIQSVMLK